MSNKETAISSIRMTCVGNGEDDILGLKKAQQAIEALGVEVSVNHITSMSALGIVVAEQKNIIVLTLKNVPLEIPAGYCIAALSERDDPSYSLVISNPDAYEEGRLLKLKENATIDCFAPIYCLQLNDFRPDVKALAITDPDRNQYIKSSVGFMINSYIFEINGPYKKAPITVPLNPKEFIPMPGQGVLAFLAPKKNKPLRRLLKQIHHPEVAKATNIERGIMAKFPEHPSNLAAYCEIDKEGNYHVYAVKPHAKTGKAHYIQHSSNTSANLVETIVKKWKEAEN